MIKGIIAAIFLLLVMVPVRALNPYGFETFINLGHVYARSAVTTEGGGPVWAEYNDNGGYSRIPSLDDMEGKVIAKAQLRTTWTVMVREKALVSCSNLRRMIE